MATGLGLTVGSMHAVAVTAPTDADAHPDGVAVVHPAALVLTDDGATLMPASGLPDGAVVTGYASRVGDPVELISDDGTAHTGEDLVAATMRSLADSLPSADAVVAAHPAAWSGYQTDVLAAALDRAGLPDVALIPEPVAALAWLHRTRPGSADAPVVVYDLGAGSLDVTVLGPGEQPEILGTPLRSEDYSGAEFDHATMRYVLDGMAGGTDGLDPFDPEAVAALTELRARCRTAKEVLSADTATVIAVDLPGVHSDVRLVREELEDLIREPLADSVNLVHEAVRGAGLELSDIGLVLLVGGSSAIPLVTELLSAALRLPVVADADPVSTAAAGAALLAADRAAASPAARDTAAFAVLGAALTDDVTAPTAPTALPVAAARRTGGLSTPKKAALISAAAAALLALTAGGLSLGTGALSPTADSQPTHGLTSPASTSGSAAPASVSSSAAPGATSGAPAADPTGTAATGGATVAPGQAQAVTVAGTPGTPTAPGTAAVPAAAADQSPAAASPAPAPTAPAAQNPAPAPAPATGGGGAGAGEVATGVGQGLGEAATGVGQGVGNVVGGVGQGVGGVVSGVGGVVGGVGNAVGGVVGGLLGN